ncbi:MAG TPA: lipopolysaccharide core heptose(II) kinase RfaY [Leptospiraceae bacterium]|nr:hypothetical protein [Leptospirales bacterium]HMX55892.1 lipopolysaccharide core heptose(II) kinase RfaY [Leptospiraceae bacterium]HMY46246.1 lipopolysaccharide core heptose(II) kinase RfaY [Leptospiraceae bacterium]HMZ36064.1 lipopolysaccharide core heptose(II) kinase RfaY [Leptospiraceae bacterium]HNE23845.1 lipopolysaccharide core heptose(II) kinase RfaY [Leptospiraceae bacterium]
MKGKTLGFLRLTGILLRSAPFALDVVMEKSRQNPRPGFIQACLRSMDGLFRALFPDASAARPHRLLRLLIQLGPTFIKIGQAMANRPDLVPLSYMHELESLQDRVPPFATWRAKRILRKELKRKGKTLSVFTVFPKTSIAAGSLGQVYECFLDDGTRVAVKIQRPGIDKKIARDIEALRILARYAASHTGIGMGVNWDDVVEEFADTIRMELDFGREMENAEKFRDNFKAWKDIYVPIFYPEYCTKKVLVMEFIDGLKLNDLPALSAADKDPMDGVRIVTRSYLKQLIQDGFFHADPHPGNLRLLEDGRVAFFDFGMAGSIDDEQKSMVLDLLIHVAEQDIHAIVQDLANLGFLRTGHDFSAFQPAIEEVFRHYLGETERDRIQIHEIVYAMSEIVYRYPFTIPTRFTYILRALLTLEGIGLSITPAFSFFRFARAYALDYFFLSQMGILAKKLLRGLIGSADLKDGWDKTKKFSRMLWNYVTNKNVLNLHLEGPEDPSEKQ